MNDTLLAEIVNAMEKCVANIKSYYDYDYPDIVKLREIEYRLGVWYGYGKVLEKIDKDKYWAIHEKHWDDMKRYEGYCRKVVREIRENKGE